MEYRIFVRGELSAAALERLADELLVDPIVETCDLRPVDSSPPARRRASGRSIAS